MKIKSLFILFLSATLLLSCSNEDIDDIITANTADLIAEESDLFELLERVTATDDSELRPIVCIRFIYSFTVAIYSENSELVRTSIVNNDSEFSELLGAVGEGQFVGVSFPITSQLPDGSVFEVTNKEELKEAIDNCVEEEQEQIIGECEGLLQTCVWEVQLPEGAGFDTYENAVFKVDADGTVDFYHRGVKFDGTWLVYFILDELHININLDDNIADDPYSTDIDWNFDWKTVIVDAETMNITNDNGDNYILKQYCDEDEYCTTLTFTECELMETPGFTSFLLEEYLECIDIIASPEPMSESATENAETEDIEYIFTFHETLEDAETNANAIDAATPYTNTASPQDLYVRIEDPDTGEYSIAVITLVVVSCP